MSVATTHTAAPSVSQRQPYPEHKDSGVEWLGDVPVHWSMTRIKYVVAINPDALPENTEFDHILRYVDIGNVDSSGVILNAQDMRFEDAPSRARRLVQSGDVIISTVRTYLKAIAFVKDADNDLVVSTGFAVLRAGLAIRADFLGWLVRSKGFIDAVVAHSEGVSYPAITPTTLASLPIWLPSLAEQRAIAAFLDRETAKTDALIAKKERQIELLREKQKALVSYTVTKGLNPSAPTRDSGVGWLGDIPSHWQTKRIRDVSLSLQTGPFGSQLHSGDYIPDSIPVINPSHMKNGHIYPDRECAIDDHTWSRLAQHRLHQGDIVFARRGELGRCALVTSQEEGWLCGTGSLRMRPNQNVVDPLYLNWLFSARGIGEWLSLESVGATMENLNTSILGRVPLPVPPIDEQRGIAAFLDRQTTMVSDLITRVDKHIDKLREHRTALISAAVTGKIDVRAGAA